MTLQLAAERDDTFGERGALVDMQVSPWHRTRRVLLGSIDDVAVIATAIVQQGPGRTSRTRRRRG